MRKILIAGNWKMHKTVPESSSLAKGIKEAVKDIKGVEIVLCPSFTSLFAVYEVIKDTRIFLGAQNVFWEKQGAYTGEVSASMLKDIGCSFVIVGHSERRKYFFETDEGINKKIKALLREGLKPILCVGETLEERQANKAFLVVETQLRGALQDIGSWGLKEIIIAYEPVWAIGTGINATPLQAEEVQKFIRTLISKMYSSQIAQDIQILYGGSVKPENIQSLIREEDIDGALVGGASLKIDSFVEIVKRSII